MLAALRTLMYSDRFIMWGDTGRFRDGTGLPSVGVEKDARARSDWIKYFTRTVSGKRLGRGTESVPSGGVQILGVKNIRKQKNAFQLALFFFEPLGCLPDCKDRGQDVTL